MTAPRRTLVLLALSALAGSSLSAQAPGLTIKEERAGLRKQARVAGPDALKTAQARFPTGKVVSGEIEKEGGKLIYSFDIKLPGAKGIEEVNVDAMTGAIVGVEHENAAMEAKEKAAEPAAKPRKPFWL